MSKERQDALVAAVRKRGSDADDPRDAAHEAHHALFAKVRAGKWGRETIHQALMRKSEGMPELLVMYEIEARAVEQLVSSDLGYDCGSVDKWAHITWMETFKNMRISLPTGDWIETAIRRSMERLTTRRGANLVLTLAKSRKR